MGGGMTIVNVSIKDDSEYTRDLIQAKLCKLMFENGDYKLLGFSKLESGSTELTFVDPATWENNREQLHAACRNSLGYHPVLKK